MNRLWRWFIHIFVGITSGIIFDINVHKGWAFTIGFLLVYELNEDWHIKDGAWKDVCGWLWGFALYAIIKEFAIFMLS